MQALEEVQVRMTEISQQQVKAIMRNDMVTERQRTREWNDCRQQFSSLIEALRVHIGQHHCSQKPSSVDF